MTKKAKELDETPAAPGKLSARKSAKAAVAAASAAASSGEGDVKLSDLAPKACHTCGRIITPRAAWAKNWGEIKMCSDSCRKQKRAKASVILDRLEPGRLAELKKGSGLSESSGLSADALWLQSTRLDDKGHVRLYVEDWVEGAIYSAASTSAAAPKSKRRACEDVEQLLKAEADSTAELFSSPSSQDAETASEAADGKTEGEGTKGPLLSALEAAPGLRERVRRAARRAVVFPEGIPEDDRDAAAERSDEGSGEPSASASRRPGRGRRAVALWQGKKRLVTLEDVSFAKGPIELDLD